MIVKFIHAADLHIDRSFEGSIPFDKRVQEKLLQANQIVLKNIVDQAVFHEVDFVLFAGDTFHQNKPSLKTQKHFFEQMERLNKINISVYMIFGNHDYYQKERYWFDFPENVHLFVDEEVKTKEFKLNSGEKVAISAFSYCHPWIQQEKVLEFPSRGNVDYHIGMYHGELGTRDHGKYAPFSSSQMQEKNYDYWALGHIHVPTIVSTNGRVVYPGAPQGHTKKEQTSISVSLVELKKSEYQAIPIEVAEVYWHRQKISFEHVHTTNEIFSMVQRQLEVPNHKFHLMELEITNYEHLGMDIVERINSGEVLEYLIGELSKYTSNFFIWRISLMKNTTQKQTILTVSKNLKHQLFESYQMSQDFKQILSELYSHPEATKLLNELPDYQSETLVAAQELINQDFQFEEDNE
nr:DNA repair exonuclease [Enterococcus sp. MSG2901]